MPRVDLPDGQWAELRTRAELTERQRRFIADPQERLTAIPGINRLFQITQQRETVTDDEFNALVAEFGIDPLVFKNTTRAVNDRRIVAAVKEWSLPDLVSEDTVIDLHGDTYDALLIAVHGIETATDFGPDADLQSPTSPSPVSVEA